jgi:hypothetical protein
MAAIDTMDAHPGATAAGRVLHGTGVLWFLVAVVGQIMFAAHVVLFYGGKALDGDIAAINKRLINGFIDGDLTGNIMLLGHLVFAFVITLGGRCSSCRRSARTRRGSITGTAASTFSPP